MWIVSLALRRPYTFIVLALVIGLLGVFTILHTPTDIFPNIKIPVVATVWRYSGLSPDEMATRLVLGSERGAQTTVNDIEHSESQSLSGIGVVKFFFQPNASEELSYSQITAMSQTGLNFAPPGTTPPYVLAFNASTVPVIQLVLSSDELSEATIFDLGQNVLRTALATVPGATLPWPYGGLQRQVQVDLDPEALRAHGLSGNDVTDAIAAQNSILPSGVQKIGDLEYFVELNSNPKLIEDLNNIPVTTRNGSVIYVHDVAHVRDGYPPQTNIARRDGRRAVLQSILKTGSVSTLDTVRGIKEQLPQIRQSLPPSMKIEAIGDQSLFVRAAVDGVVREAVIAAALTALMVLLFLGSWRSTFIIAISIPLSILVSIICLSALGETINIMTLGGLALAVGILVDDATVTIENMNWHLERGEDVEHAILEGAREIALPALVSTLAICIVFVPMFMLAGIARFLFVPLAEAVVFAMLASYLLSRTLVPTLAKYWLRRHDPDASRGARGILARFQARFEHGFLRMRDQYRALLERALLSRARFVVPFLAAMAASAILAFPMGRYLPGLGQDFFPSVDGGQIRLHLRARSGLRIDETAALCDQVEDTIRTIIPSDELATIVDNVGVPYSGINLTYSTSAPIGPSDADVYISLNPHHHASDGYVRTLRARLPLVYPSTLFTYPPADIVSQILNFGLPAPLDIQVIGYNVEGNRLYANRLLERMRSVPGAVDLRIHQVFDHPQLEVNVDRSRAALLGVTERDVASNLLTSLSGSFQTTPSFWIDPRTGSQYSITAQTPQYRLATLSDLETTPLSAPAGSTPQLLANLATFRRSVAPGVINHYNAEPVIDIFGAVQDTDLGFVSGEIDRLIAETQHDLPRGTRVKVRGQIKTMTDSFHGLIAGLAGAVLLIYLLIVVNFQSWRDPFIIITALPAALAGIVWMLFLSHTPVSVPALMGAITCMGVATANSVLVVSFARLRMDAGDNALRAALTAGFTRFRPVLMTALAMIIGMVPMALGIGEGAEQNAPLGRAVIGGLIFATVATLFFVPTVFVMIHGSKADGAANLAGDPK
jgi:CzcA family heavy metal efflux pump